MKTYVYDERGRVAGVTLPDGSVTQTATFAYSGQDCTSETHRENGTANYTGDAATTFCRTPDRAVLLPAVEWNADAGTPIRRRCITTTPIRARLQIVCRLVSRLIASTWATRRRFKTMPAGHLAVIDVTYV